MACPFLEDIGTRPTNRSQHVSALTSAGHLRPDGRPVLPRLTFGFITLIAALLLAFGAQAAEPLRIDPAAERIPLNAHIERLEDPVMHTTRL